MALRFVAVCLFEIAYHPTSRRTERVRPEECMTWILPCWIFFCAFQELISRKQAKKWSIQNSPKFLYPESPYRSNLSKLNTWNQSSGKCNHFYPEIIPTQSTMIMMCHFLSFLMNWIVFHEQFDNLWSSIEAIAVFAFGHRTVSIVWQIYWGEQRQKMRKWRCACSID